MKAGCTGCARRREAIKKRARLAWDRMNKRLGKDRPYPKWMQSSTAR